MNKKLIFCGLLLTGTLSANNNGEKPHEKIKGGRNQQLWDAVFANDADQVKKILKESHQFFKGLDRTKTNFSLMHAVKMGYEKVVETFMENGDIDDVAKDKALASAVENNKVPIVKILLKSGADANVEISPGFRALTYAANYGYPEVTRLLLERDADIEANDGAALSYAAGRGMTDTVAILLEYGADTSKVKEEANLGSYKEPIKKLIAAY